MKFPGTLTPRRFLGQHWQKKPLNIPGAIERSLPDLTADELGWLATLEDVESRLVFTERNGNKTAYRVEHGPFANAELEALPQQDWTLLIQDVEKHLPDLRAYFDLVDFVPDWRIDDLMVSFAAPGGSVGPHVDHYDVFLCQGSGRRRWLLADAGSVASAPDSGELRLLDEFLDDAALVAERGDILYLPPGIPHWGIAITACMTYSIGMRAPTRAELLGQIRNAKAPDTTPASDIFYRDPDLSCDEAVPGLITMSAIARVRATLGGVPNLADNELATALGTEVTRLKPWLQPATMEKEAAITCLEACEKNADLRLHGMARLAYFDAGNACCIYANGSCLTVAPRSISLISNMCRDRVICAATLQRALTEQEGRKLLLWCCRQGLFDLWQLPGACRTWG